ncbi:MAG: DUF1570 domain-containing protein [Planctomycetes bacterium]|nr:DUF1570 domain-containing protein [Planctomycetota bacterium]MBI3834332.1 DUF1570 domain-containing protein [Planctomycetota bacterium]
MSLRRILNSRIGAIARRVPFLIVISMPAYGCRTNHTHPVNQEFRTESWSEDGLAGRRITTEHFDFFSTILDSEFERNVPPLMESAYLAYANLAPPAHAPSRPMPVFLFHTRTEWNIYARAHYPVRYETYARIHVGGFSEGDTAVIYYFGRNTTLAALLHEGWHQYVASCLASEPPAWLNEGLACYFESGEARTNNGLVFPERSTLRVNGLRLAIYNKRMLTLREVLSINAGDVLLQNDSSLTKSYYGQVWALVAFLREGLGGRYRADFQTLLTDLSTDAYHVRESATRLSEGEASTTSPAVAAFEQYFHASVDAMDSQYQEFLRTLTTSP